MSWIIHSAKGSTWEDHKYIKRVDGVYYYPDSYEGGRHLPDGDSAKYGEYSKGDSDFDDKNYSDANRIGKSEFHSFVNKNGQVVIIEEDMKWTLPKGMTLTPDMKKALEAVGNKKHSSNADFLKDVDEVLNKKKKTGGATGMEGDAGGGTLDIDATAKEVIRGGYKNGADRKTALGANYEAVQKRVNEMIKSGDTGGGKGSSSKSGSSSNIPETSEKMKKQAAEQVKKHKEQMDKYGIKGKGNSGNKVRKAGVQHSDYEGEYLTHHGILGMRWGIRRYQNKDGTLTAEGRKRLKTYVEYDEHGRVADKDYGKARTLINKAASDDYSSASSILNNSSNATNKLSDLSKLKGDKKRSKALKKLKISEMSDQELRDAVNRMNLEDNYSRLASSRIKTGQEKTEDFLRVAGDLLAIGGTAATIALAIHQIKNGK